ncbi:hypothetical protein AS593_09650 [Caulobacter vibrioides]|nr:hypothetical protein AS593_09650 [Caulobacter vibrioides]
MARIGALFVLSAKAQVRATNLVKYGLVGVGTLLAGYCQFVEDPTSGVAWNKVLGITGVIMAFIGGIWTLRSEVHAPQALEEARRAIQEGQAATRNADRIKIQLEAGIEGLNQASRHMLELLGLARTALEIAEHLNISSLSRDDRLRHFLEVHERVLLAAMRVSGGERWTVSIYVPNGPELLRIAAACADRPDSKTPGRRWLIGQGFVGAAYQRNREIVLANAHTPDVLSILNLPDPDTVRSDAARYRSIAAVPVRVDGVTSPPWGVVIGTSNVAGRFDVTSGTEGARSADAIRIFAGAVALIVSGSQMANPPGPASPPTPTPDPAPTS